MCTICSTVYGGSDCWPSRNVVSVMTMSRSLTLEKSNFTGLPSMYSTAGPSKRISGGRSCGKDVLDQIRPGHVRQVMMSSGFHDTPLLLALARDYSLHVHALLFAHLRDELDGVADGRHRQGGVLVHLDAELLLEHRHQFDRLHALGARSSVKLFSGLIISGSSPRTRAVTALTRSATVAINLPPVSLVTCLNSSQLSVPSCADRAVNRQLATVNYLFTSSWPCGPC